MQMLESTKSFAPAQGRPRPGAAWTSQAIADGLQRISQLVTDFPQIIEMDINPFIVGRSRQRIRGRRRPHHPRREVRLRHDRNEETDVGPRLADKVRGPDRHRRGGGRAHPAGTARLRRHGLRAAAGARPRAGRPRQASCPTPRSSTCSRSATRPTPTRSSPSTSASTASSSPTTCATSSRKGCGDYTPIFLSDIPRLFNSGQTPARRGADPGHAARRARACAASASRWTSSRAPPRTPRLVIAQVNPQHAAHPGRQLHPRPRHRHAWCRSTSPSSRSQPPEPDEITRRIGEYIAALVDDGSTIEFGIGRIPAGRRRVPEGQEGPRHPHRDVHRLRSST